MTFLRRLLSLLYLKFRLRRRISSFLRCLLPLRSLYSFQKILMHPPLSPTAHLPALRQRSVRCRRQRVPFRLLCCLYFPCSVCRLSVVFCLLRLRINIAPALPHTSQDIFLPMPATRNRSSLRSFSVFSTNRFCRGRRLSLSHQAYREHCMSQK